jgi:hypothetical protein
MNNLAQLAVYNLERRPQNFMAPNHFHQTPLEYAQIQWSIAAQSDGLIPGSLLSHPDSFLGEGKRSGFSACARSDHLGSSALPATKPLVSCGNGELNQGLLLRLFAIGNFPLSFRLLIRGHC